jgi:pilus assembly protein Flp/PilA
MSQFLNRFVKDESGATAIEYGLIAAGIAIVIILGIDQVAAALNALFGNVATELQ